MATKCFTSISLRETEKVRASKRFELVELVILAPGQMKTQKEATAIRLQIEEVKQMQTEAMKRAREAEMRREGIPIDKSDRDAYSDRRYTKREDRDDRRKDKSRDKERSRSSRKDRDDRKDRDRGDRDDRRGRDDRDRRDRSRSRDRGYEILNPQKVE